MTDVSLDSALSRASVQYHGWDPNSLFNSSIQRKPSSQYDDEINEEDSVDQVKVPRDHDFEIQNWNDNDHEDKEDSEDFDDDDSLRNRKHSDDDDSSHKLTQNPGSDSDSDDSLVTARKKLSNVIRSSELNSSNRPSSNDSSHIRMNNSKETTQPPSQAHNLSKFKAATLIQKLFRGFAGRREATRCQLQNERAKIRSRQQKQQQQQQRVLTSREASSHLPTTKPFLSIPSPRENDIFNVDDEIIVHKAVRKPRLAANASNVTPNESNPIIPTHQPKHEKHQNLDQRSIEEPTRFDNANHGSVSSAQLKQSALPSSTLKRVTSKRYADEYEGDEVSLVPLRRDLDEIDQLLSTLKKEEEVDEATPPKLLTKSLKKPTTKPAYASSQSDDGGDILPEDSIDFKSMKPKQLKEIPDSKKNSSTNKDSNADVYINDSIDAVRKMAPKVEENDYDVPVLSVKSKLPVQAREQMQRAPQKELPYVSEQQQALQIQSSKQHSAKNDIIDIPILSIPKPQQVNRNPVLSIPKPQQVTREPKQDLQYRATTPDNIVIKDLLQISPPSAEPTKRDPPAVPIGPHARRKVVPNRVDESESDKQLDIKSAYEAQVQQNFPRQRQLQAQAR